MNGDTIGRLIYLLLLGLVVGGWFFAQNRQKLNKTLQQAVLWLFLFAGAVILYGLRNDLRRGLVPHQAQQISASEIVLTRAADRHFYATLQINGRPILFVIDTGATNMVLSKQDARRVGINPDALVYFSTAQTANGEVRTARVTLDIVQLGSFIDRNVTAWVNDGQMNGSLLGMSYLSRFSKLEISGDKMTLSR